MSHIITTLEAEQMTGKEIPDFSPGDTVTVQVKVKEGNRERLQAFEGVVLAKRNRGLNSAFTVRKISHGEGVERVFQTYSPLIASITLKRKGKVRRAKLYYLRELSGRKARIKEKLIDKNKVIATEKETVTEEVLEAAVAAPVEKPKPAAAAEKKSAKTKASPEKTTAKTAAEKSAAETPAKKDSTNKGENNE